MAPPAPLHGKQSKRAKFGDENLELNFDLFDEEDDRASCREIYTACCIRTGDDWLTVTYGIVLIAVSLYFLLLGLQLLGDSAQVMAGCAAGKLFEQQLNPLSSLTIGILATVLLQSSGTTTGIVVSLVDLGTIRIQDGMYIIMGANIGTSITSTIVSLASMGNKSELSRAFATATVHDMFNFFTVLVIFPLECMSNFLEKITDIISEGAEVGRGEVWKGPVKRFVAPLSHRLIISNKKYIQKVAEGASCASFYPIECDQGVSPSYGSCNQALIGCDKSTGRCPAFFRDDASQGQEQTAGVICFFLALIILFVAMMVMIHGIKSTLQGMPVKVIYTITNINGYIGIAIGVGITMLTYSSSIATSMLVPLGAIGALPLENAFPIIIGANFGTAIHTVIGSLSSTDTGPLQVALAHLFFNVIGFLLWYPLPPLRDVVIGSAQRLSNLSTHWRMVPIFYLAFFFFLIPGGLLGLSILFTSDGAAYMVVGIIFTVVASAAFFYLLFWCKFREGRTKFIAFVDRASTVGHFRRSRGLQEDSNLSNPGALTDNDDDDTPNDLDVGEESA